MLADDRYRTVLRTETDTIAALFGAADLTTPVPSCPGWRLVELGAHLGGVHRWAAHAATHDRPTDGSDPVIAENDLPEWYRASADLLHQALTRDADAACWTFGSPATVRFWLRRQLHETTMHRIDAHLALGLDGAVEPQIALDGIAEVVEMFLPRQVRLGRIAPSEAVVELCPDGGPAILLGGGGELVGRVSGSAGDLLTLLWRRIGLQDPRLEISTEDPDALQRVFDRALTP